LLVLSIGLYYNCELSFGIASQSQRYQITSSNTLSWHIFHNSLIVAPLITKLGLLGSQLHDVPFHEGLLQALHPINRNCSLNQHLHCFGQIFHNLHFFLLSHTFTSHASRCLYPYSKPTSFYNLSP
jgi:hypothetical protein